MFAATRMPTFATVVGVAPSTTTMELGAAAPVVHPKKRSPSPRSQKLQPGRRYYMPYGTFEDLRAANAGLGIINESDAWLTGRPYGLPGTATVRLSQRPGGYHDPDGYHYNASMVGGFGDADTVALTAQVQQLVATQQAQQASLKRIAFWQTVFGVITLTSFAASGIAIGIRIAQRRRAGSNQ